MSFLKFAIDVSFHKFEAALVQLLKQCQHSTQDILIPLSLTAVLLYLLLLSADGRCDRLRILQVLTIALLAVA